MANDGVPRRHRQRHRQGSRAPSTLKAPLTVGSMRRCVPFSQIAIVLDFCHTAVAHNHLLTLARRTLAIKNSSVASANMAAAYDSRSNVHQYELMDAVAVRVPGSNSRKGAAPHNLPGLVIGIETKEVGTGAKKVTHRQYRVWCSAGVLSQPVNVDHLTTLSINNFPKLLEFRDEILTVEERLPQTDSRWENPLAGTALKYDRVTVAAAWKALRDTFTQRTVDQSRKRNTATRPSANAADTAIAAQQADKRAALSLNTVSNQLVSRTTRSAPSEIVEILGVTATQYRVKWSQPEANSVVSMVGQAWLDKHGDYAALVQSYRRMQQKRLELLEG